MRMDDMKELPIALDVDFTVNLMDCLPLCIISANERLKNWVNENFMLPVACMGSGGALNYMITDGVKYGANYQNPEALVRHSFICSSALRGIGCIVDFLIERIDMDWYGIIFVDQYYVEGTPSYQKRHYAHELLVYGYDKNARMFNAIVYGKKLQAVRISFDVLEKSFWEVFSVPNFTEEGGYEYTLMLYQFVKHTEDYPFDREAFLRKLELYRKGALPDKVFFEKLLYMSYEKQDCFFGIRATEALIAKMKMDKDKFINKLYEEESILFKLYSAFYTYAEFHKALLKKMVFYAEYQNIYLENEKAFQEYGGIVRISEQMRMLYLKLNVQFFRRDDLGVVRTLDAIIRDLDYISEKEPKIMGQLSF